MNIRLYLDEDTMDSHLVLALRARGVDVITASDAGMIERLDDEHLEYASLQGRALYSFNAGDYQLLHTRYIEQNKHHCGIILAQQQRYSVGEQMRRLLRLIGSISAEEMIDNIVFLSSWG
jgi:hypothetical protein